MEGPDTRRRHMFHYPYNHQSDCHTSNIRVSCSSTRKFMAVWLWDSHQPVKYPWNAEPIWLHWNKHGSRNMEEDSIKVCKSKNVLYVRFFLSFFTMLTLISRYFMPYFPNPRFSRNWSSNKSKQQHYKTFWQLCINKHGLRPPPFSVFVSTQPWLCHGTPVRDCLWVAEPCLGLGPKPDNLTVIHSKLIKHLQRCHEGERVLFISVLHH